MRVLRLRQASSRLWTAHAAADDDAWVWCCGGWCSYISSDRSESDLCLRMALHCPSTARAGPALGLGGARARPATTACSCSGGGCGTACLPACPARRCWSWCSAALRQYPRPLCGVHWLHQWRQPPAGPGQRALLDRPGAVQRCVRPRASVTCSFLGVCMSPWWHRKLARLASRCCCLCCACMHACRQFDRLRPCLLPKIFQDFPSHRILRQMHEALNIDENKN